MDKRLLKAQLIKHEGFRNFPYKDTTGHLTIGVGRNLSSRGLSSIEVEFLLDNDMMAVLVDLDRVLPWWRTLDTARQLVLADMCFNLGISKLLTFENTLDAMEKYNFIKAADHMMLSLWYSQVGERAKTLVRMMRTGSID